jgi:hypothetical protein
LGLALEVVCEDALADIPWKKFFAQSSGSSWVEESQART